MIAYNLFCFEMHFVQLPCFFAIFLLFCLGQSIFNAGWLISSFSLIISYKCKGINFEALWVVVVIEISLETSLRSCSTSSGFVKLFRVQ